MTSLACGRCGSPDASPIGEADLAALADDRQVAAAAGGLALLGLRVARGFAAGSLRGLAFCGACRGTREKIANPFLLPKALAGAGFFFGLTLIGMPVALILYVASFLVLRRRLRAYRERPTAAALPPALDAVGTLAVACLGSAMTVAAVGLAVVYLVYFKSS